MNKNNVSLVKTNDETYSEYNLRSERFTAKCAGHNTVIVGSYSIYSVLDTCKRLRNKLQTLNRRLLKVKHQNKLLRQEIERLRLREWESFTCK